MPPYFEIISFFGNFILQGAEELEEENTYLKDKLKELSESNVRLTFNLFLTPFSYLIDKICRTFSVVV